MATRHSDAVIKGDAACCTNMDEAALLASLVDMHCGRGADGSDIGGNGRVEGVGGNAPGDAKGTSPANPSTDSSEPGANGEGVPNVVWRVIFRNALGRTPYFVASHAASKQLVISVRGSLSLSDAATDVWAVPAPLPKGIDGDVFGAKSPPCAHEGILRAAENLLRDLQKYEVLETLLLKPGAKYNGWSVLVTGHSLGAGVAAILTLLLRHAWRKTHPKQVARLRCHAFSPPGGLLSRRVAKASSEFITSVFVEDDIVPRLALSTIQLLRDECIAALATSQLSKFEVMRGGTSALCGSTGGDIEECQRPVVNLSMVEDEDGRRPEVVWNREVSPTDAGAQLIELHRSSQQTRARAMWPPGQLVMLRKDSVRAGACWRAERLLHPEQLQRIKLTATMMLHHLPNNVLCAIQESRAAEQPIDPSLRSKLALL